jgi:hypothetical protein
VAKRLPPSQRSERQLDESARAIARLREEAKAPEKSADEAKAAETSKTAPSRLAKSITSRKVSAPPAFPSTKRPKMG